MTVSASDPPYDTTVGANVTGKALDLSQLLADMLTAGVAILALGTQGPGLGDPPTWPTMLFTYDASGKPSDLPPAALPMLAAHVPAPVVARTTRIANVRSEISAAQNLNDLETALLQLTDLL